MAIILSCRVAIVFSPFIKCAQLLHVTIVCFYHLLQNTPLLLLHFTFSYIQCECNSTLFRFAGGLYCRPSRDTLYYKKQPHKKVSFMCSFENISNHCFSLAKENTKFFFSFVSLVFTILVAPLRGASKYGTPPRYCTYNMSGTYIPGTSK